MNAARVKLVMLAAFAYWASGVAQYLHERIEHCPDSGECQAATCNLSAPGVHSVQPGRHSHSEEDCPICSMLAHMSVGQSAPPPLIHLAHYCHASPIVPDHRTPLSSYELFLPSRGPPSVA